MARVSICLTVLLTIIIANTLHYYILFHNSAQTEHEPLMIGLDANDSVSHALKIVLYDPFIAYIPDFVSLVERNYLINLS